MRFGSALAPFEVELRRAWRERDEALAALKEARAEVTALRCQLVEKDQQIHKQQRQIEQQHKQLDRLKAELEESRRAGKRQAAPFRRRKRKDNPRQPGRKPGHPAANRPMIRRR